MNDSMLKNLVWQEVYYVAQSLIADVSNFGESKEEVLNNLEEALNLFFENA
jgi:predicted RNase H-like HicB family nuclease